MRRTKKKFKKGDKIIIRPIEDILKDYEKYNIPTSVRLPMDDLRTISGKIGLIVDMRMTEGDAFIDIRFSKQLGSAEVYSSHGVLPVEIF